MSAKGMVMRMAYQNVFKRYEVKYLITDEQKKKLLKVMEPYMRIDKYGRTNIRNIYFDTDTYELIRKSIEKPMYKEKLRVRSYGCPQSNSDVFVELKKKYDGIVYKRRLSLPEKDAKNAFINNEALPVNSQIGREIDYFRNYYDTLRPTVFLSYDREAYYTLIESDFRITFDSNIFSRLNDFNLSSDTYGYPVLPEGMNIMEGKTSTAIPLWLAHFLSEEKIYKTSFSKYGATYQKYIQNTTEA